MNFHVFNTWVLANLLHPFIFLIGGWIAEGAVFNLFGGFGAALLAGILVMMVSFPSLLASWIIFPLICKLPYPTIGKFGCWLFIATGLPYLNAMLLLLMLGDPEVNFFITSLTISALAMLSVAITICIRVKKFFQLFYQTQISPNETGLV